MGIIDTEEPYRQSDQGLYMEDYLVGLTRIVLFGKVQTGHDCSLYQVRIIHVKNVPWYVFLDRVGRYTGDNGNAMFP